MLGMLLGFYVQDKAITWYQHRRDARIEALLDKEEEDRIAWEQDALSFMHNQLQTLGKTDDELSK
jgi:hypothetical protein